MRGGGIKKILIFGLSNWLGGGVTAEMEKILGGAGIGENQEFWKRGN